MFFINAAEGIVHNFKVVTSITIFGDSCNNCNEIWIQADPTDMAGSVPDHRIKANTAIKRHTKFLAFRCI